MAFLAIGMVRDICTCDYYRLSFGFPFGFLVLVIPKAYTRKTITEYVSDFNKLLFKQPGLVLK